jgi:hypothetical protein
MTERVDRGDPIEPPANTPGVGVDGQGRLIAYPACDPPREPPGVFARG